MDAHGDCYCHNGHCTPRADGTVSEEREMSGLIIHSFFELLYRLILKNT